MTISKVTLNQINPTVPTNTATTATDNSKNIQNQITSKEQHLNRLTSDSKLSTEEKEKKRQEIQKEIDELNRKLEVLRMRQEAAERKAAAKQEKTSSLKEDIRVKDDVSAKGNLQSKEDAAKNESGKNVSDKQPVDTSETIKEKQKHIDMAIEDMQKMLTADYALQKELVQKHVDAQIDNTVNVLKAEIKQDDLRDSDTSSKEAEIEIIRAKENFWTEEAKNQTSKPESSETQPVTGMNVNAQVSIDAI